MSGPTGALPLQQHAIQVHPDDNVAVIKFGFEEGTSIEMPGQDPLLVRGQPTAGHRFALVEIP
ncbi:MAG: hypothetical protein HRU16_11385, partial [Planctomycetes bacterium]|nr:hypothetical protein [Planctomycetota bacterium]